MSRLFPSGLLGQLVLLVMGAFVATQAISLLLFTDERGEAILAAQRLETTDRVVAVLRALEVAPVESRADILRAVNSRLVQFSHDKASMIEAGVADFPSIRDRLADLLAGTPAQDVRSEEIPISPHGGERASPPAPFSWLHERMLAAGIAPVEMRLSVALGDGTWLNVASRFQKPDAQFPPRVFATSMMFLVLLMAALWIGLSRITGPIRRLALAADEFGLEGSRPDMPLGGPKEVNALSDALVRMHDRLTTMIADRTRMLAALGHDLRSPITALRLRVETVEDEEARERMVASLDEMQEMVEATLAYARGVSSDQPSEPVELVAMLAELSKEVSLTGATVRLELCSPMTLTLRRVPMRRALRNLIENAQRYGDGARISIMKDRKEVRIRIDDYGPGIPEGDLERVFDPFARLETSRSRDTGGTGLGLPIARSIIRAHGGEIQLSNRAEGGVRAEVTLPLDN